MKYNHAMAEREYKREWKAAKLEMRKAGMQRKQIREAARVYRLEFNGERRFYRRNDVVPACEREDRPPKGVDTLFQESHSMHSPDLEDDIGGLIDQVERSDLLSWLRSLTVPFPVSWTVKMKKKQKETQDILSYHSQAAGCSDKARAKASGGRQPIEECGRTGL